MRTLTTRVIGGAIAADGTIARAGEFTATKSSTGVYIVRFPATFRVTAFSATPYSGTNQTLSTSAITPNSIQVNIFAATSGAPNDAYFHFQAVGPA